MLLSKIFWYTLYSLLYNVYNVKLSNITIFRLISNIRLIFLILLTHYYIFFFHNFFFNYFYERDVVSFDELTWYHSVIPFETRFPSREILVVSLQVFETATGCIEKTCFRIMTRCCIPRRKLFSTDHSYVIW